MPTELPEIPEQSSKEEAFPWKYLIWAIMFLISNLVTYLANKKPDHEVDSGCQVNLLKMAELMKNNNSDNLEGTKDEAEAKKKDEKIKTLEDIINSGNYKVQKDILPKVKQINKSNER